MKYQIVVNGTTHRGRADLESTVNAAVGMGGYVTSMGKPLLVGLDLSKLYITNQVLNNLCNPLMLDSTRKAIQTKIDKLTDEDVMVGNIHKVVETITESVDAKSLAKRIKVAANPEKYATRFARAMVKHHKAMTSRISEAVLEQAGEVVKPRKKRTRN